MFDLHESKYAISFSVLFGLIIFGAQPSLAIGLDDMNPAKKQGADAVDSPSLNSPSRSSDKPAVPTQPEKSEPLPQESAPQKSEPGRTERWLTDNLTLGVGTNLVWPNRSGGWKNGGTGRTGNADLIVSMTIPNSVFNQLKRKDLKFKGTFRYNPVVVAGTYESLPYRGVWAGYHGGIEAHMVLPDFQGMTAIAGVEAGFVLVYLDPLDEFEKAKSSESTGAMVTLHGGSDWSVGNGLKFGPRLYLGFGSVQNYQLGATTTFVF